MPVRSSSLRAVAGCALTPLALCLSHAVWAQAAPAAGEKSLSTVTVNASADASAEGLSPSYAGGQVARGGRAGILGTRDNMETPFSITSYTNELIQDRQARSVGEVLQNDPTVRTARGFGNFQEAYFVRGFILNSDDTAYNGLYSLMPRQYIATELFERVEVLRGASAFLTGAAPNGSLGGAINLLPKRAPNEPLSRVTVGVGSGGQASVSTDIARRFGPDGATGIRLNAAYRGGDTAVDDEHSKLGLLALGMDWRSRDVRLSGDIGWQDNRLKRTRTNVAVGAALTSIPAAPDASANYAQPWSYSNEKDWFGTFRAEVDLNSNLTAWAAYGLRRSEEANSLANLTLANAATGAGTTSRFDNAREDRVDTGELGLRGKFRTGSVGHEVVASISAFQLKKDNAYALGRGSTLATNLYNPVAYAQPALTYLGNDLSDPAYNGATKLQSFAIGDTVSLMDERLLLTLGLRHQKMKVEDVSYRIVDNGVVTQPGGVRKEYDKSRTSPVAGLVFKITPQFSAYANYIEGLVKGDSAPATVPGNVPVTNSGEDLPPYVSKQKEIGLKFDGGRFGGGVALFSIDKPRAVTTVTGSTAVFSAAGKDRHQGVELTMYGEAMRGLRVLGGLTWLDAKQRSTGSSTTDGKRVIGVPKTQASIGAELDVPGVRGLAVDGRVVYTGSSYANAVNTLQAPSWTRLDVGARYLMEVQGKALTLRARVDNLFDKNYWASTGGYPGSGYLVVGAPRTFTLSASVDF
ncbi:MAG: TonB-dependent siderophore receptor [Variovorax paradoxus]|nr:MAG: TonB-dependent siderophore receptor [Variovorax paradoxus]PZQ16703.1 MAG: TonB-dependent siderophore receptor [Variovorax paradoxus]